MNQLKVGALLSYLIIGINMIVGLVYTPYMLRMLGQSEYGMYSLVASIIAYLTVLDLGFANALIRYTAKYRAERKIDEQYELFGMFLKLYSIIGFVVLLIGLVLYFNVSRLFGPTMSQEELSLMRSLMLLMLFNLTFTFPLSIFGAIITAYERFVFQKMINLVRVVLNPIVMVLFLFLGYKVMMLVIITTIFNFSTLFINCYYCFRILKIKVFFRKFNTELFSKIASYSVWIFLAMIMNKIYWSLGQFILGVYKGPQSVAIYALSIQLILMFFAFNSAIHSLFLPRFTSMISKGCSENQVSDTFIKTGRLQYVVMSLIVSTFILIGKEFVVFWAGQSYERSYIITLIIIIPMAFVLIQSVGLSIMQARNSVKFYGILSIMIAILCVCASIPLSIWYGDIGCAIATASVLIVGNLIVLNIFYSKKHKLNIKKFWLNILQLSITPILLLPLFMYIKQYYILDSLISTMQFAFGFSIIYAICFWIISLNENEKSLITLLLKQGVKWLKK